MIQITLCPREKSHYIVCMNSTLARFTWLCLAGSSFAGALADIDHVDTRVEWSGTPTLRLGDQFTIGNFVLGAFMEVRNDDRFHQEYLPNHNWRGVVRIAHEQVFARGSWGQAMVPLSFQHESAHASMGIEEPTQSAFESIYDGKYRNVNRNGFAGGVRYQLQRFFAMTIEGLYVRYLRSRNAPEAADTHLSDGHAMTWGADVQVPFGRAPVALCISSYFRQEFEGSEKRISSVYYDGESGPIAQKVRYAPLQATRTVAALLGIRYLKSSHPVLLYASWAFGNQGGFMDSREEIHRVAWGIQLGES